MVFVKHHEYWCKEQNYTNEGVGETSYLLVLVHRKLCPNDGVRKTSPILMLVR